MYPLYVKINLNLKNKVPWGRSGTSLFLFIREIKRLVYQLNKFESLIKKTYYEIIESYDGIPGGSLGCPRIHWLRYSQK